MTGGLAAGPSLGRPHNPNLGGVAFRSRVVRLGAGATPCQSAMARTLQPGGGGAPVRVHSLAADAQHWRGTKGLFVPRAPRDAWACRALEPTSARTPGAIYDVGACPHRPSLATAVARSARKHAPAFGKGAPRFASLAALRTGNHRCATAKGPYTSAESVGPGHYDAARSSLRMRGRYRPSYAMGGRSARF